MNEKDLEQLKKIILSPKKTQTEAGSVEERSTDELEEGLKMVEKIEAKQRGPLMNRVGFYGRWNV